MASPNEKAVTGTGRSEHASETRRSSKRASIDFEAQKNLRTVEAGLDPADIDAVLNVDPKEEARILRKIDFRLVPLLALLYLLAFIDRSNIGNARIAGMYEDLELYGLRYNAAVTIFFVPYTLLEVPSNIVLKMLRPSIWLSILCFSWGLVMTLMGLVNSYAGLLVARFFLGVAEAGFFPAATYLLTIWYRRYEVQRRMAVFYAAASLSGAFSGLLAYGIEQMDGIGGRSGWQWIFLLEGLAPVVVSFTLYFLLPDNPETASFLTKEEKEFIVNRLALDTGSKSSKAARVTNNDKIGMQHIKAAFKDWRIWVAIIMFWANTVSQHKATSLRGSIIYFSRRITSPTRAIITDYSQIGVYGFTATVPAVINGLGYTSAQAQLLTIPVYVFAMILTLVFAWWSDRVEQRSPFIMAGYSIACVGFIAELAIPHPNLPGLTYAFLFVVAAGLYAPFICIVCIIGNNLAPSSKRAVGMALLISIGNMGGIAGSNIYIAREAPHYRTGFATSLSMCVCGIIAAFVLRTVYSRENKRRDAFLDGKTEEEVLAQYTEQELLDLGDRNPYFRYTL